MREADEVVVRTRDLPSAATLDEEGIAYETLDSLYESCRNYDTLTRKMVAELKRRAKGKHLCYCVDCAAEDAVAHLLLEDSGNSCIEGVGKASSLAARAGIYGAYTAISAFELEGRELTLPLIVYDVTADNAAETKLLLAERFGDEYPILAASGSLREMKLYEIDRLEENTFSIVLKETPLLEKHRFTFEDVLTVLRRLRAPDGCPWDKVQTHESIRINAIEEAYELVDAIDLHDTEKMCEEAGDVLMQALFHTLIEEERGGFTVGDMLTGLCEKLISRHTHVFGKDGAETAEGALAVWDRNKMAEKHQTTFSSAVNDVPACFPALLRAQKVAKRVEKGGWSKPTLAFFEETFQEEYAELRAAMERGDANVVMEEMGDLLMCVVSLGRAAGVDCEQALLDTVKKVSSRYTRYEALVLADGKDVLTLTEEEKDMYYERAKRDTSD